MYLYRLGRLRHPWARSGRWPARHPDTRGAEGHPRGERADGAGGFDTSLIGQSIDDRPVRKLNAMKNRGGVGGLLNIQSMDCELVQILNAMARIRIIPVLADIPGRFGQRELFGFVREEHRGC